MALVLVPLLLLTTPSRGTPHASTRVGGSPHAGHAAAGGVADTTWTLPAVLADMVRAQSASGASTATTGQAAGTDSPDVTASSVPRAVNAVSLAWHRPLSATTTTTAPGAIELASASASGPAPAAAAESTVAPAPTSTTASPRPVSPTTTTTTAPPPPRPAPTTTTTAPPAHAATGVASWYAAPAGTCASPSLAFGTVLTVTDQATGKSVTCTVDDRQAGAPGRVVDLAEATFAQLADPSTGVIDVRLTW